MKPDNARFAVIVRFESENPDNQHSPLVYYHNKPKAAARRLAALINCRNANKRARWLPSKVVVGTRFYIADRHTAMQHSLTNFRQLFLEGN